MLRIFLSKSGDQVFLKFKDEGEATTYANEPGLYAHPDYAGHVSCGAFFNAIAMKVHKL